MAQSSTQQSIDRAMAKARQVASTGVSPRFLGWAFGLGRVYLVASANNPLHDYTVTARRVARGVATTCDCQAAQRGLICYHRALVQLDLAGELAPAFAMAGD